MPRDPLAVSPLRLIVTTTQVFPQQPLVCCPSSVVRARDEVRWAAKQWAVIDAEKEAVAELGGAERSTGVRAGERVRPTRAAVWQRREALRTLRPVGPHWPAGLAYYHGIGESHRDLSFSIPPPNTDPLPPPPSRKDHSKQGGCDRKGVADAGGPLVAYPYNMLCLQPCPRMGEGQLEVVAAAPIPAYTCFAYCGPVRDERKVGAAAATATAASAEGGGGAPEPPAPASPYVLTLRQQTTVQGQGITRYFNHRYRCDAFGNAQFSSVSIPTRRGMAIEVPPPAGEGNEEGGAEGAGNVDTDTAPTKGRKTTAKKKAAKGGKRPRTPTPPHQSGAEDSLPPLLSLPFFFTTRDIAAGEPILATSYGTAYDAQLERTVFGAGEAGPLPPYLQQWWATKKGGNGPDGLSSVGLRDYEGEFRWDVRAGDIVVRILSEEERGFFSPPSPPPPSFDSEGFGAHSSFPSQQCFSRLFVVRDVDPEANVLLIAPLIPRIVSPLHATSSGIKITSAQVGFARGSGDGRPPPPPLSPPCVREYLLPEGPADDAFRAIVHYSTVAPLYDEDDYVGLRIGGARSFGGPSRAAGGGRGIAAVGGQKRESVAPLVSIHLRPEVAATIATFPSPAELRGCAPPHSSLFPSDTNDSSVAYAFGMLDCALDGCLWPMFAGIGSDEAAAKGHAARRGDEE